VVLFNEVSGATHLLTLDALVVLQQMGAAPTHESVLAAALRERFEVDESTLSDDVAVLLQQLSSLNLIEPCPL
jgi:PqqD family protein of HPr-rel-A system